MASWQTLRLSAYLLGDSIGNEKSLHSAVSVTYLFHNDQMAILQHLSLLNH
jgi:hypothetical protein